MEVVTEFSNKAITQARHSPDFFLKIIVKMMFHLSLALHPVPVPEPRHNVDGQGHLLDRPRGVLEAGHGDCRKTPGDLPGISSE